MTRYASYNPSTAAPSPITGWYDTEEFSYPAMPPDTDLIQMTDAQWNARSTGQWAVANNALVAYTPPIVINIRAAAQYALDKSDITVLRCYENSVAVPSDWVAYRTSLRKIVSDGLGQLPDRPEFPPNTDR